MITENLPILKINKLSQKQYDRESVAGNLNENEIYLTPDKSISIWQPNTEYKVGNIVLATWKNEDKKETVIAECNEAHTSSSSFTNDLIIYAVWDMNFINARGDEYGRSIYETYATKEDLAEAIGQALEGDY